MELIRSQKGLDVLLVGRCFADNENMGLGYLDAALCSSGIRCEVHYLNTVQDMTAAAARVISLNPRLVGISMADGGSSVALLAFGDMLRRRGYAGHITCGGQFATLSREWLLSRYVWLDSVVRHAGEVPIVALAKALREHHPLRTVPGLTTRDGDGAAANVTSEVPFELVPTRGELSSILKHRAAQITAGRGCAGRCRYCSPASLQMGEIREGRRDGISAATLRHVGVGGARRRHLHSVCNEMAQLYHDRDVRYFYFVDEHMLPYDEAAALQYLADFKKGLERRGVGKIGIGTMLRADRVTPAMLDSFVDLGLVRAFIGLEFGDPQDSIHYGRSVPGQTELQLISRLHSQGVATISNLMLVHPTARAEGVRNSLALLDTLPEGSVEVSRMMVYHGTRLHRQLAKEGNLTGNPIRYGYRLPTPEMERFAQIADRLRAEVFFNHSIAHRSYDVALHAALGKRVYGDDVFHRAWSTTSQLNTEIRRLYVAGYGSALDMALAGVPERNVSDRLAEISAALVPIRDRLERIRADMIDADDGQWQWLQPFKTVAAASVLTFAFTNGCAEVGEAEQPDTETVSDTDADSDADTDSDTDTDTDADTDADSDTDSDTDTDTDADTDADSDTDIERVCEEMTKHDVEQVQGKAIGEANRCFTGRLHRTPPPNWNAAFSPYNGSDTYNGQLLSLCAHVPTPERITDLEDSTATMADSMAIPCPLTVPYFDVYGPDGVAQGTALHEVAFGDCLGYEWLGFEIELDAAGAVIDVRAPTNSSSWPEPATPEILECLRSALSGLLFPCLAETTLCSEYIIVE